MLPFFPQDCTRLWTCNLGLVCFRKIIQAIACPLCIGIFIVSHIMLCFWAFFWRYKSDRGWGEREVGCNKGPQVEFETCTWGAQLYQLSYWGTLPCLCCFHGFICWYSLKMTGTRMRDFILWTHLKLWIVYFFFMYSGTVCTVWLKCRFFFPPTFSAISCNSSSIKSHSLICQKSDIG